MSQFKNILIHRLGSLGDFVVALPCLHLIRRTYPDARIVLLTNHPVSGKAAPAMQILAGSGLCDESMAYPLNLRRLKPLLALRRSIKTYSFDLVVQLTSNRPWWSALRDYLFFHACGIHRIVGASLKIGEGSIRHSTQLLVEQECSRLARRLHKLGKVDLVNRANWSLNLTQGERDSAANLLRDHEIKQPFLVASVGTKSPVNDWGDENWISFLATVSQAVPSLALIMVGSADEAERSDKVRQAWHGDSFNLCGQCPPRITGAIFVQAVQFVGHDSGPMHLAAAADVPTVGIFSWHNPPGQWFPGWHDWNNIKVFYPPLSEGGWHAGLRMRRSPSEGILLIKPDEVAAYCIQVIGAENPLMARKDIPA